MSSPVAHVRQAIEGGQPHQSSQAVLDRRTLANDHRVLAALVRPAMRVLDAGGVPELLEHAGLSSIETSVQDETVVRGEPGEFTGLTAFARHAGEC